jgi:glycosyltransferase involved in cell wall biosynthesis
VTYRPLAVIPLYNHSKTLPAVARGLRKYFKDILIVDDGSTDGAAQALKDLGLPYISFPKNRGKGAAIKAAAVYAGANNFTHILTIDADNQHYPHDLARISAAAQADGLAVIIGFRDFSASNVPKSSKFGRKFSAFWAKVQTGRDVPDIQSGLRAYPVKIFDLLQVRDNRYSFEMEIIIKAIWAGFEVKSIPVSVHYPKKEERISHFNIFWDNARISLLNTRLTLRALLPLPHQTFVKEGAHVVKANPFAVLKEEFKNKENPRRLGLSAAWSVFWGSLALPGVRTLCLLLGIGYFNLNRPVALTMDKLALPPFIPALCVETGYFLRHGRWLTEFNLTTLGRQAPQRVLEWVLGSLVVAPLFAFFVGLLVWACGHMIRRGLR